jgi:hypothetical protein
LDFVSLYQISDYSSFINDSNAEFTAFDKSPFWKIQQNKQILIDAVVHAVNEDYAEMANDFTRLGFLASGTDVAPIIPALEAIWQNSVGKGLSDFNFRSVTGEFCLILVEIICVVSVVPCTHFKTLCLIVFYHCSKYIFRIFFI